MTPAEIVPDEIVEKALKRVSIHFYNCDAGDSWRDCQNCVLLFDKAQRTICAALGALDGAGMVVVSAYDLNRALSCLEAASSEWAHYVPDETELVTRLRASLPERTSDG